MTNILLTYGKHKSTEVIAYRMGRFLERYENKYFRVRECYISWRPDILDFSGPPEAYLWKLIERPELHIDLHQGRQENTTTIKYGNLERVIKIPPTMKQVGFEFVTSETMLTQYHIKKKGVEISGSLGMLIYLKLHNLFGARYIALEVKTPINWNPRQSEIEELSEGLYKILIRLPKNKKLLNQFILEFNEKEEDRVWFEVFGR